MNIANIFHRDFTNKVQLKVIYFRTRRNTAQQRAQPMPLKEKGSNKNQLNATKPTIIDNLKARKIYTIRKYKSWQIPSRPA